MQAKADPIPTHSSNIPVQSNSFFTRLMDSFLGIMKKILENSKWTSAIPLGVYLTFVSHVSRAQEVQHGRDNDGERYVFYPFHTDHLKGELFKNERDMYAMFLHFQTKEIHTPEHPHVQVFIKNDMGEAVIKPYTMEYIHNALTDISTLSMALEEDDFSSILGADEILYFTMETTDNQRLSYINIPSDERKVIPQTAQKLVEVDFQD